MRFKPTRTFAAVAMVLGALAATNTGAVRPEAVADGSVLITPAWMPVGLSKQPVNVVVQLAGDPVTVQQETAGRKLSKAEKAAAKNALKGPQNALKSQIEAMGGTVVNTYQSAYNGIKVRIARNKAEQLATLPGVIGVRPLQIMRPTNTNGVPLISAPSVWQNLGLHGENIKIAIIDTGVDYTHANFGGPGTVAAYDTAHAAETRRRESGVVRPRGPARQGRHRPRRRQLQRRSGLRHLPANPASGSESARLPSYSGSVGHGTHVAGSAAGSGVLANGKTYTGLYNATTISGNAWTVGPGVAPKADLYAVRVFGCDGSTDVTVDAIEWAVDNDMDVINMSLGSAFGTKDDPSAVASTNAAKAGVVVVTSAGNSGSSPYITGSPGTGDGSIATAANDPLQLVQGIRINTTPPTGTPLSLQAINANGVTTGLPITGPLVVLKDNPATTTDIPGFIGSANEALGCHASAYTFNGVAAGNEQIAVAKRGSCARVAKAIFAQKAGAAVAVMTNNAAGLPPFEGPITANPDTGEPYIVTIPFAGVAGSQTSATSDSGRLQASPPGTTAALSVQNFANPGFMGFASFSSGGPRTGDSGLKPDITAPGLSIFSTAAGTGNGGKFLSGTSMASPHVAGVAALTRQAHPTWKAEEIKAAIVNTGLPSGVTGYRTSRGGTGLVQPVASTRSQVTASADDKKFVVGINFGFEELKDDFNKKKTIRLRNNGSTAATFNIAQANPQGSPHTVNLNKTVVTVPARRDAVVEVTLRVPAATAGDATAFQEVAGLIQFTPVSASDNGGVALRVPYYLVPRANSDVSTKLGRLDATHPSAVAEVTNKNGVIPGNADFYAWGLDGKNDPGKVSNDIRAVGVQSFAFPNAADPDRALIVFAVNTRNRWSNASVNEFDIGVDVDGDGVDDYVVVGADQGAIQTGVFNGIMGSFVFSTRSAGAEHRVPGGCRDRRLDGAAARHVDAALPRRRTVPYQEWEPAAHVQRGRLRSQRKRRSQCGSRHGEVQCLEQCDQHRRFRDRRTGCHGHVQRDRGQLGRVGADAGAWRDGRHHRQPERQGRSAADQREDQEVGRRRTATGERPAFAGLSLLGLVHRVGNSPWRRSFGNGAAARSLRYATCRRHRPIHCAVSFSCTAFWPSRAARPREVDAVERLVLVEAGKHVAGLAASPDRVRLQALRADLLHHALHRRVDRADRASGCGFR